MNRQLDLKALVSHIVTGDGMDKCRICMGETTEGQVFLSDTVMLEDDRPITLAELLEMVTGVEVNMQISLPEAVCSHCVTAAMRAAEFGNFCRESESTWYHTLSTLGRIPLLKSLRKGTKGLFIVIGNGDIQIVTDQAGGLDNKEHAVDRLQARLYQIKYGNHRNKLLREGNRCECPHCGKKFFYAYLLHNHLNRADVDHQACPLCGEIMSRSKLITHLIGFHDKMPYPCKRCPMIFKTETGQSKHSEKYHMSRGRTCPQCRCTFSEKKYQTHISTHVQKKCPGCDKHFSNRSCYIYHTSRCKNVAKNVIEQRNVSNTSADVCFCDICKKRFLSKKSIIVHMQNVHLRNSLRTCPHCPKTMPSAYIKQHLRSHKINKEFTCKYCQLHLKTKLGYVQHLRLHTGEKPYPCKECGEAFSTSSRRSEHIKRKHRSPDEIFLRHPCPFCPSKFRLPYRLRNHIASVHMLKTSEQNLYQCGVSKKLLVVSKGVKQHNKTFDHIMVSKNQGS